MSSENTPPVLCELSCVPCRGGIPPLTPAEAKNLLKQTPEWALSENSTRIERNYSFANFRAALTFTNAVGELAEQEGHHPDMTLGWGYCKVVFYTHKIAGLHENDFIMAAKADSLYGGTGKN